MKFKIGPKKISTFLDILSTLRVWRLDTAQCLRILSPHTDAITSVYLIHNDHHLVTASYDYSIRITNLNTEEENPTPFAIFENGHENRIWECKISQHEKWVVSSSFDTNVVVWCVETYEILQTLIGHEDEVSAIVSGDKLVISASHDGTCRVQCMLFLPQMLS